MYARVGTYQGEADGLVQGFESQTEALQQVEGFERAYFLIDRDAGKAMTITVWESKEALEASAEAAAKMREDATQPTGAQITDVNHYEVAITLGD
jgi:heme-degrading monooxygenase HmoA